MERREFLKLTLGLTAAAGAIAVTAATAQAAPMLPDTGNVTPPEGAAKTAETAAQGTTEPAAKDDHNAITTGDTDMSAHRRRRWRRRWYRRRRRWWRRRRVIYY